MENLIPYYVAYSIFSSIAHRYKLLSGTPNLFELEKIISPLLRSEEINKIKVAVNTLKFEKLYLGLEC